ncbi:hypothetical protein BDZ89DRAFT_1166477 [Hymenopellis radicata]|nr:hypothetical protein BDZ89DRAFT_1166477 [Hymenopellis radicata]
MSSVLGKRRPQTTKAPPKKKRSNEHQLPSHAFQLRLSTLRFVGDPRLVWGDDEPEVVGSWDIPSGSPPHINLQPDGYSKSEEAFIYRPIRPFSFIYKRSTRVLWNHEDEDSALAYDHEDQSPRLYLHPDDSHQRPYRGSIFDMDKADEYEAPRLQQDSPPFPIIVTCDYDSSSHVVLATRASRYRTLFIEEPDVEGANDACGNTGKAFYGWFGDWAKAFIKADWKNWGKQTLSDPALGCIECIQWSNGYNNSKAKLWGIDVRLEPCGRRTESQYARRRR